MNPVGRGADADRIIALRMEANRLESRSCTGLTARWCPVHGDCACPDGEGDLGRTFDGPNCPLHAVASNHAGESL